LETGERTRPLTGLLAALVAGLVLGGSSIGCRSTRHHRPVSPVVIRLPRGPSPDLRALSFEPPGHVTSVRLDEVRNLSVETDGTTLTARLPELCPIPIPAAPAGEAGPTVVEARPRLEITRDLAQIGYDAPFEVVAERGCPGAPPGHVTFRQTGGPPLLDWSVDEPADHTARLRARTLARSRFFADPLPPGIVAVSPRTEGRYTIEAALSGAGLPVVRRTIIVTSSARATGLSSLAVSQRVMLGGEGWRVERAPFGSRAGIEVQQGVPTFAPDVAGRWILAGAKGGRVAVQAMTHDHTPLDCGRAECHAAIAAAIVPTAMSQALARVSPTAREIPPGDAGCMLDCHVVGERGLRDGGFLDVADKLGFRPAGGWSYEELPHALQRLGGVRCTSCHGPGAIPEADDRARILRVSVCATCHDFPPANTHVDAWSRSAMARADHEPRTRREPACRRCHTTGGFLDAIGVRRRADGSRDPDDAVVGVSCAACHAVHGEHVGEALVRAVEPPASLGPAARGVASSVCAPCHAPQPGEVIPSASSAALVAGRFVLPDALGGAEQRGPAPHAALRGECTGCHGASATGAPGTDHSFRVDRRTCTKCHRQGDPAESIDRVAGSVQRRARALVAELSRGCLAGADAGASQGTPHAAPRRLGGCQLPPERARALFNASLVMEDRAAGVHNAPFSRLLLDRAESLLHPPRSARVRGPTP
jgi:hypothetical protein